MKPGFSPKPTALKILAGNPSRRPLPKNEPQPQRGRPNCPQWLGKEAKATWKKLAPLLDNMGVLTLIDGNALTRYCVMFAEWRKLWEFIEPRGTIYTLKAQGKLPAAVMTWPQVRTALALGEQLGKLEREFGLTPSARACLHTLPPGETEVVPRGKDRFLALPGGHSA